MPAQRNARGRGAWHRQMPARQRLAPPPLWLRGLILAVVLWLAVRIVGNVTQSLTGIFAGHGPPQATQSGRGP